MQPVFLDLAEIVLIHQDQIRRYGGAEGILDMGLLQSALAMPPSGAGGEYFHGDIYAMAAAYLFHIVRNHPFVDGNKRVGAVAAFVFLALNGIDLDAPEDAYEELVMGVASSRVTKDEVAAFLRRHGGQ